jgi:mono/diheme cytochrome c family protein
MCIVSVGCSETDSDKSPHIISDNPIESGRYLVIMGGCNDCHTNGYLATEGKVPEEDWLTGSPVGWQGPWGVTYPPNLRLRVQEWTEDEWVTILKTRTGLPPMPWMNVNKMNEIDARAIYAYIKSLGPKGDHMPLALGPNEIPQTPYLSLFPQNLHLPSAKN